MATDTASSSPTLLSVRNNDQKAAIIFVHGFKSNLLDTWDSFLSLVTQDSNLEDWDIYSAGYSTSLAMDIDVWSSDNELDVLGIGLATLLRNPPLDKYTAIALVAHSMGGLVVQKAIVENDDLISRLSHVVNYGTPSNGAVIGGLARFYKKQLRDMGPGSDFLIKLRTQWKEKIGDNPDFLFQAVAGELDALVPAESCIGPFPASQQSVVPGNHREIIQPDSVNHLSYVLLNKLLTNSRGDLSSVESARLAVEQKDFQKAIDLLMPGASGLDANAVVTLALALESVGRKEDSIAVIENWNNTNGGKSLDALGVLAGRLKRRWLVGRQQNDYDRALELYSQGLALAEEHRDDSQAYYHAINIAYMKLAATTSTGDIPQDVREMASCALKHAEAAPENHWSLATIGEANLILGEFDAALDAYRKARETAPTLREIASMQMQAVSVAQRVFGDSKAKKVEQIFIGKYSPPLS